MPEHRSPDRLAGEGTGQEFVADERPAQRRRVVAQLPDLGGRLDDQRQTAPGEHPGAPRAQERVGRPRGQQRSDGRVGHVESVVPEGDLEPGGVAAPHLQAVECAERLLDRQEDRLSGSAGRIGRRGECGHATGGTQAVVGDRPGGVPEPHERCVSRFPVTDAGLERRLDGRELCAHRCQVLGDCVEQAARAEQGLEPRGTPEEGVDLLQATRSLGEVDGIACAEQVGGPSDGGDHCVGQGGRAGGGAPKHRDDAAHRVLVSFPQPSDDPSSRLGLDSTPSPL